MHFLSMLSVVADEAAAAFNLSEVIQSAVTSVQGELLKTLAIVVPSVAVIIGACTGVKFGFRWLKSLGKA